MKMTKEQKEKAEQWFRKHMPKDVCCDFCKKNEFRLLDTIHSLPTIQEDEENNLSYDISNIMPIIIFYCRNCGRFYYFSAIIVGILSFKKDNKIIKFVKRMGFRS